MGGGVLFTCLVFAVLWRDSSSEERWSRLASPERRQHSDWVPLTCANCRPVAEQGLQAQASDSLPSVLTPPPREEGARLLPPPPPDGLLQQAATGFLQAYTQQQPPHRKPHQFLQETSQSVNRPQAQFLKSSKPSPQQYLQEPSQEFQPPQPQFSTQSTRQLLPFNQQGVPESPYLNQPLLIGPQFLASPFFPQTSIPQVQPLNLQPISPIAPNAAPLPKDNYQFADRPVFLQQITASQQPAFPPQQPIGQNPASQFQYSINQTENNKGGENEEVQLLYVPVETLNQRAKNLGRPKALPSNQQVKTQLVGTEGNRFTNPGKNFEFSTIKPQLVDQNSFNIETAKQQFNIQNPQFQQQQPPDDQEQLLTQTHTVRQQFLKQPQDHQFQQPKFESSQNYKADPQVIKQQYNFKQAVFQKQADQFQKQSDQFQKQADQFQTQADQFQKQNFQSQGGFNLQFQTQQNGQFQQQSPIDGVGDNQFPAQSANQQPYLQQPLQAEDQHFQTQTINTNQQFTTQQNINNFQQQLPPLGQSTLSSQSEFNKQEIRNQANVQVQPLQVNQPGVKTLREQPYLNHQINLEQQLTKDQVTTQQLPTELNLSQQNQQAEIHHQTVSPVPRTRAPEVYTTQEVKRQRFRTQSQDISRNTQQLQTVQPVQQFTQGYQQNEFFSTTPQEQQQDVTTQGHSLSQHHTSPVQQNFNTQHYQQDNSNYQQVQDSHTQSNYYQESTVTSPASSTPLPQKTTPAPNQPPLSVYMETTEDTKVNDVLRLLKNAKTIQVLDTVGPESPQVFVGPSNLKAPAGYIKFELPYLNSLENNRVERKVDKLPFFVAPLNFNPPPGYSKIPFPAPHIGSVVVSNVTVLKNAFHEKGLGPQTESSSERYLDQYTLPAEIPPISPQLPSLINSLQDEIYSNPSTTALPSPTATTTEQTTVYTTPYRGRGPSRGSQRGSSNYATSPNPTRRPHSRTRRPYDGKPYSRRQSTTTPTTTIEPSTEASVPQFTPQAEQLSFNSDVYNVQNTASPVAVENNQQYLSSTNTGTIYDDRFTNNQFNQERFASNQQQILNQQFTQNQNVQPADSSTNTQPAQQYFENPQLTQNNYVPAQEVAQSTAAPTVASLPVEEEKQTFKSQRNGGTRRDPNRQHQRFRGRQRLTTTTTENYEEPTLPIEQQFNQQVNYQNNLNRNHPRFQQRLVENTHFTASVPANNLNIQTERADVGVQTTERVLHANHENQFNQQNFNTNSNNPQLNVDHRTQQQILSQSVQPINHQAALNYQPQEALVSHAQPTFDISNYNSTNLRSQEFDYVQAQLQSIQGQVTPQEHQEDYQHVKFAQQVNFGQANLPTDNSQQLAHPEQQYVNNNQEKQNGVYNSNIGQTRPAAQDYTQTQTTFDQLTQQNQQERQPAVQEQSQAQNQEQYTSDQQLFLSNQGNLGGSVNVNQNTQGQQFSTDGQYQQFAAVIPPNVGPQASLSEQHALAQTPETQTAQPKLVDDSNVHHNQERLVKYSRTHSRQPVTSVEQQFQANVDQSDVSTTDEATTRASLVRVRGRVRSRLRGSTRSHQSTTTETPNYPNSYLSRQNSNQEKVEESHEYTPRKRVNYGGRQTSKYNNNRESAERSTEQSSQERSSSSERYQDQDYSSVTTTSTEEPTTKAMKRYQHILNRNKVRRVRPTNSPSTSGSSGTTKFLLPTTTPPVTRLPATRGRIRKPVNIKKTTTTEYPQVNPSWNERDNFAPSAGSNEILEPLYQTKDKAQPSFVYQQSPSPVVLPQRTTPKPIAAQPDGNDFWNQDVTIQQSTSFDFKPDGSVTPSSFQSEDSKAQPIWNGHIELEDGNYYDVFNQRIQPKSATDQTPFSSDQQKVVYKDIKSRLSEGKEDQYPEKAFEVKRPFENEEETSLGQRVYPVYRDIVKPAESEETSQVFDDSYLVEEKKHQEKEVSEHFDEEQQNTETLNTEAENGKKEGSLKRKIQATIPGKKGGRRRGSWVRVRVRKTGQGQDMFETAESQNLASVSENSIQAVTKTSDSKGQDPWSTHEPSTEPPQTNTEAVSEPAETINFEDALKDMLKEFITNSEQEEVAATEGNTETPPDAKNKTEESQPVAADHFTTKVNEEKDDTPHTEKTLESNVESDGESVKQDEGKTAIPETVSEIAQESTTTFHPEDNSETTIDPEVTTQPKEHNSDDSHQPNREYSIQPSRILGTSTTTEISLETEICYRGRCVKTKKGERKGDKEESVSDLLSME